jgi:hypothetical protein
MKYYETTCSEYIAASKRVDMHSELSSIAESMPSSLNQLGNIIFYGPSGSGKYTQFLRFIEKYAAGGLKTEKMTATTEKQKYEYHISEAHYEIDMALLGCESKKLWNECFLQIVDVVSAKQSKCGIILCKNFQSIHSELLDVFYSYMQHCRALSIHIVFAILTEHVSFIPNRILQCCKLISVKRPDAELYHLASNEVGETHNAAIKSHKYFMQKIHPQMVASSASRGGYGGGGYGGGGYGGADISSAFGIAKNTLSESVEVGVRGLPKGEVTKLSGLETKYEFRRLNKPPPSSGKTEIVPEYLPNMKEMHSIAKIDSPPKDVFNIVCDNIIAKMVQHETLDIISLRDNLYDILLYGLDVTECLWYIVYYFAESEIFVDETGEVLSEIMDKMDAFLKFYNNNYRPIYHLESIFIYLITKIYRYPNEPKTRV